MLSATGRRFATLLLVTGVGRIASECAGGFFANEKGGATLLELDTGDSCKTKKEELSGPLQGL